MDYRVDMNDFYSNIERSTQLKVRLRYFRYIFEFIFSPSIYSLQRLSQPYEADNWIDSPQGTKAYYSLQTNEIVFPAGILQKPLYDINNPKAVNYGALGIF